MTDTTREFIAGLRNFVALYCQCMMTVVGRLQLGALNHRDLLNRSTGEASRTVDRNLTKLRT